MVIKNTMVKQILSLNVLLFKIVVIFYTQNFGTVLQCEYLEFTFLITYKQST